jgi:DNA-binding MarR family transcriptional regulator
LVDASDGRVNLMSVTPAGLAARTTVLALMRLQLASALGSMSAADVHQLARLLNGLVAGLRNLRVEEPV